MLKYRLGEKIGVWKLGNKDVVHPKNVNPLSYSQATLKGHGLREDDICKAFSNLVMVNNKLLPVIIPRIIPQEQYFKMDATMKTPKQLNLRVERIEEATEEIDFGSYKISKKRKSIPSFPEYEDKYYNSDILDKSFQRDIAWALLNAVGNDCVKKLKPEANIDELMEVGSWTAFMKDTTSIGTTKCKLEYLPVVPFPPSDNIVKWYMDMIVQLACVCACRRSNQ